MRALSKYMTHWTINETALLNVTVSSMVDVIDSDEQCCHL